MDNDFCIITVSLNPGATILKLIDSLKSQSDLGFTWILVDGGSVDGTLSLVNKIDFPFRVKVFINNNDFGIYHALNAAVDACEAAYYVVAGCDDYFYTDAVKEYKMEMLSSAADIISSRVRVDGGTLAARSTRLIWLYGARSLVSSHSIGVAIKTDIHRFIGKYSSRYPIIADSEFLLRAHRAGLSFGCVSFVAGYFSSRGVSNRSQLASFSEQFGILSANGYNFWLQWILFNLRLLKWACFCRFSGIENDDN